MATKSKSKGEWKTKTLKEWKQSEAVVWRAQMSQAPDGTEFIGVRQYILTAKSGEIAGRSGITVKMDGQSSQSLTKILSLMRSCIAALEDLGELDEPEEGDIEDEMAEDDSPTPSKFVKIPAPKAVPRAAKAAGTFVTQFQLKKDTGKFLLSVSAESVKVTSDQGKAQLFSRKQAEKVLSDRLSDSWSVVAA